MRATLLIAAALLLTGALACSKATTPAERAANTPQHVTLVGCVQQGADPDEFVIRGRTVVGTAQNPTGPEPGGLSTDITHEGGDAERVASTGGTREDKAQRLTPRLVSDNPGAVKAELGRRVVVTGEFVPAGMDAPLDQLKVATIARVADSCITE